MKVYRKLSCECLHMISIWKGLYHVVDVVAVSSKLQRGDECERGPCYDPDDD